MTNDSPTSHKNVNAAKQNCEKNIQHSEKENAQIDQIIENTEKAQNLVALGWYPITFAMDFEF